MAGGAKGDDSGGLGLVGTLVNLLAAVRAIFAVVLPPPPPARRT
jgi:hypothetical protein